MYQEILKFWFEEIEESQWWVKDDLFDQLIIERFSSVYERAVRCELFDWRKNAEGRLAEIIVLDQFSRNMFRGSRQSFANDPLALALSQEAVSLKADTDLSPIEKSFLYMPFMHSESLDIHQIAKTLFKRSGNQSSYDFEIKHNDMIEKFGRYPHRNAILGRKSTEEEKKYLEHPGAGF